MKDLLGHASDLPSADRIKVEALFRPARTAFEVCLERLRSTFPDDRIRLLADLVWKIVGAGVVPTVLATDEAMLRALSAFSGVNFALLGKSGGKRGGKNNGEDLVESTAVLFVSPVLHELVKKAPSVQAGAIVFGGSQAIDAWMGKFGPMTSVDLARAVASSKTRAHVWEAHFLAKLRDGEPRFRPNRWQKETLEAWTAGWDSPGAMEHWSEPKRWET